MRRRPRHWAHAPAIHAASHFDMKKELHGFLSEAYHLVLFPIHARDSPLCLTNKFHVAVRLFSNRSQMTSKCGKNKKVAHEAIAECVTDVLTTFSRLL